jgi:hypothetical protein
MASLPVLGLAGGVTMDAVAYRMTTLNAEGASAALEGGRRMCQGHHRFRAAGTPAQGGTGQRRHRGDRLHGGAYVGPRVRRRPPATSAEARGATSTASARTSTLRTSASRRHASSQSVLRCAETLRYCVAWRSTGIGA